MYTFYNDMRGQIINFSLINKKTLLTDNEIKKLKPYQEATQELKDDFDSSVLNGGLSRGIPKAKTKVLNSPFSSSIMPKDEVFEIDHIDADKPINVSPYYKNQNLSSDATFLPIVNQKSKGEYLDIKTIISKKNAPKLSTKSLEKTTDIHSSPYYYAPSEIDPIDQLIA